MNARVLIVIAILGLMGVDARNIVLVLFIMALFGACGT